MGEQCDVPGAERDVRTMIPNGTTNPNEGSREQDTQQPKRTVCRLEGGL